MNFIQRFFDPKSFWMVSPEAMIDVLRRISLDSAIVFPASAKTDEAEGEPPYTLSDGVATLTLSGVIVRKATPAECEYFGLCSLEQVAASLSLAERDPEVRAILLNIDSPGGEACGTPEFAEAVENATKPVAAWTGGMMASAAYYIGSQADAVHSSKSSLVGSVGTIMTTYDWTGYLAKLGIKPSVFTDSPLKGAGNPAQALSEEQRAYLQGLVDQIGAAFRAQVRVTRGDVPDSSMQGQIFVGQSSVDAGLVDRISTINEAANELLTLTR